MKKFYITTILSLFAIIAVAAPKIRAVVNNGKWNSATTWDLNRIPQDGDTVIVPLNTTLLVIDNINISTSNLYLAIYGTLRFAQNGKLSMAPNTTVMVLKNGTIDGSGSPAEMLRIGNDVKFAGDEPPISGPVVADANTGNTFIYNASAPIILPVKFIGISVAIKNNQVVVEWATAEETNAAYYDVQRSLDGINWLSAGTVKAAGNTSQVSNYTLTDKNQSAKLIYYRIKQVDENGVYTFTAVKTLRNAEKADVAITAVQNKVAVQFSAPVSGTVEIRIISLNGQVLAKQTITNPIGQQVINTSNLNGAYVVTVSTQQTVLSARQVIL